MELIYGIQMTKKYGGESVLGFSVTDMNSQYWCIPHTIWKTKDGNYRDVTYKNVNSIQFIPIKVYDPSLQYWFIPFEYRKKWIERKKLLTKLD